MLLLVAAVIALGAAGFYGLPYLTPAPAVVHPDSQSQLDPAVEALLKPMLSAAEANPRDAAAHAELGIAYEANGLWNEAQKSYSNAVQLDKDTEAWHLHQAIVARQNGDFETAINILRTQAPKHPTSAVMQNHYAEALMEAGDLEGAELAFRNLIQLAAGNAQGYVGLGDIMIQKGAGAEAVQLLEQAVKINPRYKQAHYLLGRAYSMTGREDEAKRALAKGVDSQIQYLPDALSSKIASYTVNATGRISQASTYLNTGNPEQAAKLLEESYPYHNTNVMLLNTLASAYLKTRRLDDAHRLLNRARDLDEDQFFTYLNLYTWALRSGKKDAALGFADEAIARAPERDDTHLARAQALAELGRLDEALVSAQEAMHIDGNKAGNHGLVGDILYRLQQYADAETHLTEALSLDPNLLPALVGLAQTKWAMDNREEAQQLLQRAQQMAPNHPRVQQIAREFSSSR